MFPVQTPLGTQLIFGCPTVNFEPLPKGQPHYLHVNHCTFYNFDPKVTKRIVTTQPCYEVLVDIRSKLFQCRYEYRVSEPDPSIMAKSWSWGSQIAVKKISNLIFFSRYQTICIFKLSFSQFMES